MLLRMGKRTTLVVMGIILTAFIAVIITQGQKDRLIHETFQAAVDAQRLEANWTRVRSAEQGMQLEPEYHSLEADWVDARSNFQLSFYGFIATRPAELGLFNSELLERLDQESQAYEAAADQVHEMFWDLPQDEKPRLGLRSWFSQVNPPMDNLSLRRLERNLKLLETKQNNVHELILQLSRDVERKLGQRIGAIRSENKVVRLFIIAGTVIVMLCAVFFSIFVDRNQKIQDRALSLSEKRLSKTIGALRDGVIATNDHGEITMINPVAQKMLGWNGDEAIGQLLDTVFRMKQQDSGLFIFDPLGTAQIMSESEQHHKPMTMVTKDGEEITINCQASTIKDDNGIEQGSVLVFRDISKQVAEHDQRNMSERMQSIGTLAGGVSSDFSRMLSSILESVEELDDELGSSSTRQSIRTQGLLQRIVEVARQAGGMTKQLKAFSQKTNVTLRAFDVHDGIENAAKYLRYNAHSKISIDLHLNAEQSFIKADKDQFQSIMLNLGENAIEAMPKGGTLRISTICENVRRARGLNSGLRLEPNEYIIITIEDTGCGISQDALQRIFEPFFSTKEKGGGLGLSVVYGAVRDNRGGIEVETVQGGGTAIHVYLPILTTERGSERYYNTEKAQTVLFVDDDAMSRQLGTAIIQGFGAKVILAKDGQEALVIYRERRSEINFVMLDLYMPLMTGQDCFAALIKEDPEVRVLLISAVPRNDEINNMIDKGALGFVQKPLKSESVTEFFKSATS